MSYIVQYLKPEQKRFYKREKAERFAREQYKVLHFLQVQKGRCYELYIPIGAVREGVTQTGEAE
jgi:hypothetical protein